MRHSHTLTFPINCGYATAYDFLSDPSTFGDWAGVAAGSYREIKETGNGQVWPAMESGAIASRRPTNMACSTTRSVFQTAPACSIRCG